MMITLGFFKILTSVLIDCVILLGNGLAFYELIIQHISDKSNVKSNTIDEKRQLLYYICNENK